jgi:hypothetical protein
MIVNGLFRYPIKGEYLTTSAVFELISAILFLLGIGRKLRNKKEKTQN